MPLDFSESKNLLKVFERNNLGVKFMSLLLILKNAGIRKFIAKYHVIKVKLETMTTGKQPNNPLHGITLESIVPALVAHYGWSGLAERIPVRCFSNDPSISSSLKFLRKTPWARDKVEALYLSIQDV